MHSSIHHRMKSKCTTKKTEMLKNEHRVKKKEVEEKTGWEWESVSEKEKKKCKKYYQAQNEHDEMKLMCTNEFSIGVGGNATKK